MSIRRNGLVCTTTPGSGRSASTRMVPATTVSSPKRSRSSGRWSSPLSSGSTSPGGARDALERLPQPGGLRRDHQRVHRLLAGARRARVSDELPQSHRAHPQSTLGDQRGRGLARDDDRRRARAVERARHQAAHPAGAEHRDRMAVPCGHRIAVAPALRPRRRSAPETPRPHRGGSTSTPGLRTPRGSTAAFAPRSAAANGSGRWRSYHGR